MNDDHAVTDVLLEVFRLNGALLASGDALVADLGLTSARWQVLGAVALAATPLPVATIARRMGLSRQNVQRIADDLSARGLLEFAPNPDHQRAKLVLLTKRGESVYAAAAARQKPWAEALAAGLSAARLGEARDILRALRTRLEADETSKPNMERARC